MTIFINGEERQIQDGLSLSGALEALDLPKQRVAVELNRSVIRKQDWENTKIADNDRLEVVHFVGGG